MADLHKNRRLTWLTQAVLGASQSIDVVLHLKPFSRMDESITQYVETGLCALVDERLRRRCLIHFPQHPAERMMVAATSDDFIKLGWEVRSLSTPPSLDLLLIDCSVCLIGAGIDLEYRMSNIEEPEATDRLVSYFETVWRGTDKGEGRFDLVYEDLIRTSVPRDGREVARVSEETWDAIIKMLARHPDGMRLLEPKRFEELVAELLSREGFDVTHTQATRDGGRDIIAFHNSPVGRHMYLVECKRWSPERPIGVSLVRTLYGVVEKERASAGLLITTSRFTADALEFAKDLRYRVSLKDYDDLVAWVKGQL